MEGRHKMKTEKEIECDICKNVLDGSKIYEAGKSKIIKQVMEIIDDELTYTTHQVVNGRAPKRDIKLWQNGYEAGYKNGIAKFEKVKSKLGDLAK